MTFILRDFQQRVIDEVIESAKTHQNIVIQAMTGSGKTIIASAILKRFNDKNRKAIFFVDRIALTSQTVEKLGDIKHGIIASGYPEPNYDDCNIFVAMVQTFEDRPDWHDKHWDLQMYDECHDTSFRKLSLKLIEKSTKWVIGLTATPYRLSKKEWIADIFEDAIIAPNFAELQKMGYLAKLEYYGVDHADFSQVKIIRGDYCEKQIGDIVNAESTIKMCLEAYLKYAKDKRVIAFGVDVIHAKHILNVALNMGITAELVIGKTNSKRKKDTETSDREDIFKRCEDGETQMLVTCDTLSKGFDLPAIKSVLLMAPSLSVSRIEQRVGRAARPYKGETAIIIDCVGNLELVGYPCERVHTRESVLSRKPLKEAGEAPVKTCPECARIVAAYHKNCPFCGYYFIPKAKEITDFTGDISKLILSRDVKDINTEEIHKQYYRQLIRKNYKLNACGSGAYREYCNRKFELYPKPIIAWALGALFDGDKKHFDKYCYNVQNFANRRVKEAQRSWFIRAQIVNEFGNYTNKIFSKPEKIIEC